MRVSGFLDSSYLRVSNYENLESAKKDDSNNNPSKTKLDDLTTSQKAQVAKLQSIDQKVKAHESAHINAGGSIVKGGANFTYEKGPDNKLYAVAGEVPIDASPEDKPEKTIAKMQQVRAAALAPADPSGTDYKVASTATLLEMKARVELAKEQTEKLTQKNGYTATLEDQ